MEWTKEDKEKLLSFKQTVDSDDIKIKEQIKKVLLDNKFICHVLNNKELEESDAEPDDYYYVNILPYFIIPDTQTKTKNFICFEVGYKKDNIDRYNRTQKTLQITFYILCHHSDITDEDTGVARHDLLAALVQDQFNYTTLLSGGRLELDEDYPSTTDNKYSTRTLIFNQKTDNNLVKTKNNITKIINKDISIGQISKEIS